MIDTTADSRGFIRLMNSHNQKEGVNGAAGHTTSDTLGTAIANLQTDSYVAAKSPGRESGCRSTVRNQQRPGKNGGWHRYALNYDCALRTTLVEVNMRHCGAQNMWTRAMMQYWTVRVQIYSE
jgi:hypothetical protein